MDRSYNASTLLSAFHILAIPSDFQSNLMKLLLTAQEQMAYSSVILLRHLPRLTSEVEVDIDARIQASLGLPAIKLTVSKFYEVKTFFKDNFLAIAFVSPSTYEDIVGALQKDLHQTAQTNIVFVCSDMENLLMELFSLCWKKKMLNTIAVFNETYSSYTAFPEMQIHSHSLLEKRVVFPNQMLNMYGYPLRIVIDGVEPRNYVYTNRKGKRSLGGYSIHLIEALAENLNATLTTPIENDYQVLHFSDYQASLKNDIIDIYTGLGLLNLVIRGISDVLEIMQWCIIVPVEPIVPQCLYYPMIFKSLPILLVFGMVFVFSFIINCFLRVECNIKLDLRRMFLNEDCIRAILGQSFTEVHRGSMKLRLIYFFSCVMGLFFSTWYLAILNTLVTSPPTDLPITTLDDIRLSPFRILLFRREYEEVREKTDQLEAYLDTVEFIDNSTAYHIIRNSLNKTYVYATATNKWRIFQEQQSYYKTPLYRKTDICIDRFAMMVYLVHENSIFTRELNKIILRVHQSGLFSHWVSMSFIELVEAKRLKMAPQEEDRGPNPLRLYDMTWIWGLFGALTLIDCVVFVAELACSRVFK